MTNYILNKFLMLRYLSDFDTLTIVFRKKNMGCDVLTWNHLYTISTIAIANTVPFTVQYYMITFTNTQDNWDVMCQAGERY